MCELWSDRGAPGTCRGIARNAQRNWGWAGLCTRADTWLKLALPPGPRSIYMSDRLHRDKAIMAGENLTPSWARRWQDCAFPLEVQPLVATNAEWKCIAHTCRYIHAMSITSSAFPLHVYNIQIGACHYAHQMRPFIACHLSFPVQKERL